MIIEACPCIGSEPAQGWPEPLVPESKRDFRYRVIVEALMRKILVILGILLLGLGVPGLAGAYTLENSGFEEGDFTGWTTNSLVFTGVVTGSTTHDGQIYLPVWGDYFAVATAGLGAYVRTQISQTLWLNAGEILTGWALFDCQESRLYGDTTYNDTAAVIVNIGASYHYRWGSTRAAVGPYGHTAWESWFFTADESGYHTIIYEVYNGGDNLQSSRAYFDAYQISDPVPLPGAVWLLGSGLPGLIGIGRKLKS